MALSREDQHHWHVAINQYVWPKDGHVRDHEAVKWMYEAKEMSSEVPRLALLFKLERTNGLTKTHRQCSRCEPETVPDNHLTCCLGIECRECPELLALNTMEAAPEAIDEAKAWTCATHIAFSGGDVAREGYLLTVDDRMFWDRVYGSMAESCDPDDEAQDATSPHGSNGQSKS